MFKATFRMCWDDDNRPEQKDIYTDTVEEICEYAYKAYFNSLNPHACFICGSGDNSDGILAASYSLPMKNGLYGNLGLMRIVHETAKGSTIVYDRNKWYTSPKTLIVFNSFAEVARAREANKYGEW